MLHKSRAQAEPAAAKAVMRICIKHLWRVGEVCISYKTVPARRGGEREPGNRHPVSITLAMWTPRRGKRDEEEHESVQTRPVEPDSENPQTRTFSEATVCGSRKARPKGHHTLSLKVKKERRSRW